MTTTGDAIRERSGRHLGEIAAGTALDEAVLTWDGYLTAAMEWSLIAISEHEGLFDDIHSPLNGRTLGSNLFRSPPDIEEEWELIEQERRLAEGDLDPYPGYRTTYWSRIAAIRGFLRVASSEAGQREVALQWSGYVVALEEHGLVPPGHAARLMAELVPHLRPGDPWETIAAQAGVALGTAEAARVRQQG